MANAHALTTAAAAIKVEWADLNRVWESRNALQLKSSNELQKGAEMATVIY